MKRRAHYPGDIKPTHRNDNVHLVGLLQRRHAKGWLDIAMFAELSEHFGHPATTCL